MNEALLSIKNMNWCTPQDFLDRLNFVDNLFAKYNFGGADNE